MLVSRVFAMDSNENIQYEYVDVQKKKNKKNLNK
jgi:hypothetical protein